MFTARNVSSDGTSAEVGVYLPAGSGPRFNAMCRVRTGMSMGDLAANQPALFFAQVYPNPLPVAKRPNMHLFGQAIDGSTSVLRHVPRYASRTMPNSPCPVIDPRVMDVRLHVFTLEQGTYVEDLVSPELVRAAVAAATLLVSAQITPADYR